ncbi:N-ethylammeline chlorohydrolase [Streptococcus pneumoniae]|nr:N-ethylammeline chlorohydrolase [Streptococcus pneumoniae]
MRFNVGRFTSFSTEIELLPKIFLYSMKIKVQTRKLAAGCSKHGFEVVDETDEVSSKHGFEVVDETDEVSNHTYGKATMTWFEEIFEEYKN